MSLVCHIDKTVHADRAALHRHLRGKMKQEEYYLQHEPRHDLGTGAPIPFKTVEQYLSQEFIDRESIKRYIKEQPAKAREWAISWLKRRKEEKGLVYAPSQVELRSLQCPTMPYYDSVGGYYDIARELGYRERYVNETLAFINVVKGVMQDSREQTPLKLPGVVTTVIKLDYGDYQAVGPADHGVYIERKGLGDFVGTLNCRKIERKKKGEDSAFERFDRELTRAAANGHYIVMLVESSIQTALQYDDENSPHYVESMRHSSAGPAHVFKNLRDLLTKYPLSFQAVFADGRAEAARIALKIFTMGDQVRQIDLQNAVERKLL